MGVACLWFSNIKEIVKPLLSLKSSYFSNKDYYKTYTNYSAININRSKDVPGDYYEEMGVPISFIERINFNQFKIIGLDRELVKEKTGKRSRFYIDNKELYARIVIKRKI